MSYYTNVTIYIIINPGMNNTDICLHYNLFNVLYSFPFITFESKNSNATSMSPSGCHVTYMYMKILLEGLLEKGSRDPGVDLALDVGWLPG